MGLAAGLLANSRYAADNVSHAVLYLAVFLWGILTTAVLALLHANMADNLLHVALAVVLGLVGAGVRE